MAVGKRRKRVGKKRSSTRSRARRRRVSGTAAVGATVGRRRRRSVRGTAAVGRRRRRVGSSKSGMGMEIVELAVGVGLGATATHMLIRPLEEKLTMRYPMAGKFMGAGEIVLGGMLYLWSGNKWIKSMGIGVLAGGVHVVMKQVPGLGMHSPAEKMSGLNDMTHLRIPIGQDGLRASLSGLIDNSGSRYVKTNTVGNMNIIKHDRGAAGPVRTSVVAGYDELHNTLTVGAADDDGLTQDERDILFTSKGM